MFPTYQNTKKNFHIRHYLMLKFNARFLDEYVLCLREYLKFKYRCVDGFSSMAFEAAGDGVEDSLSDGHLLGVVVSRPLTEKQSFVFPSACNNDSTEAFETLYKIFMCSHKAEVSKQKIPA